MKAAIQGRNIAFYIDGSYFPENSAHISAHMIITSNKYKIGTVDFISIVAPKYRSAYTAELCRSLAMFCVMEYLILTLPDMKIGSYQILISSDCQSVLNFLLSSPKVILNSSLLHLVKREIKRIQVEYRIRTTPHKVSVH